MARIDIRFHGLPKEIVDFAQECAKEFRLYSVGIVFFPDFKAEIIEECGCFEDIGKVDRICLCDSEPDLAANSALEFSRRNPDCLSLSIGKYDNECLGESGLGAQTENKNALMIWRKIAKKLSAFTSEGAWAISPHTGARTFDKKHRYTAAAKKAADDGVLIKPIAGWNHYVLGTEV